MVTEWELSCSINPSEKKSGTSEDRLWLDVWFYYSGEHHSDRKQPGMAAVLEITVGHRTLSDQISEMSGQFRIMIGHDDRTSNQLILSYLLQGVASP